MSLFNQPRAREEIATLRGKFPAAIALYIEAVDKPVASFTAFSLKSFI
jgi:hypothetical protein